MLADYNDYEIVSGLEIHVELLTKTKMFCACSTAFGAMANVNTCPVCAGLPGSLPVVNREAVDMAVRLGLALGCQIAETTHFDRKNYFYPDNPQNYQITQLYSPICKSGKLDINVDGHKKSIGITQMHLEDDAGKLIHDGDKTLIDYNRSGVPLIEIVTEPDFGSADEVIAFLKSLIEILKELEICDCKMQEGSLRVDVNISVREKGSDIYGVRSEIKNINSFTEIKHAMAYEKKRKTACVFNGQLMVQDTRGWDEKNAKSFFMREKENERDYRYFPEPDIPVIRIRKEDIDRLKATLPLLPEEKKALLKNKYKISENETEFLYKDKNILGLFEKTVKEYNKPKTVLNWLQGEYMHLLDVKKAGSDEVRINPSGFARLIKITDEKTISMQTAKELLEKLFEEDFDVEDYVNEKGLGLSSDKDMLYKTAVLVIEENEKSVADYMAGKEKALQFLIGQAMKHLKGRANVQILTECIKKELDKRV